ncbi:MAG: dTDP-4-dehydrorhamnose reductase [bacterium]|nr:dTDP-4-dehydrorhamnose reductase [bacterium]
MKVLVTGFKGQLGYDVVKELDKRGITSCGVDIDDFDITDAGQTLDFIKNYDPCVVVHCAAYTAVDRAEDDVDTCRRVNAEGTKNLCLAAKAVDAKFIYISTDYVYPGNGDEPYEVTDATAPLSVYGKTKLEGENYVREILEKYFIIRTSWVFGKNGNNFVKTMLRLGKELESLTVVCDQVGSPTYTPDLAVLICDMLMTENYGIYHGTNEGFCSWAEFAAEIMTQANLGAKIIPVTTAEYKPSKASRPTNSRLSKKCLVENGFNRLPPWTDALARYLKEIDVN